MTQSLIKEIYEFVTGFCGVNYEKLTPDTTLNNHLGIVGGDGDEFMEEFANRFKVDLSDFNFYKYFGHEGMDLVSPMFLPFKQTEGKDISWAGTIPLKLEDLHEAVILGKWTREMEEAHPYPALTPTRQLQNFGIALLVFSWNALIVAMLFGGVCATFSKIF